MNALLDSESAAAAYRFTIRPGDTTVFDVEMAIYPRVDLDRAGLAPMTSMFFFGPNDRKDVDDFRPSCHDSDGLAIFNGWGEELWRPLHNPRDLEVSSFADLNPRGFGLMQRQKDFAAYQDLESNFETPAERVGGADRRLGRGRGQAARDPDQGRGSTTTSQHSGNPKRRCQRRASMPHLPACTGGRTSRSLPLWHVFPGPRIGARGDNATLFVLDVTGEKLKSVDPKRCAAS